MHTDDPTPLPVFRYHPDPVATGSIVPSRAACTVCGRTRGYAYDGPVYAGSEDEGALCPWCIADGSAHRALDATFVDEEGFADGIPDAARCEIAQRTPGYSAWQEEVWPACCEDAMAFLGPVGVEDIRRSWPEYEGLVLGYIVYDLGLSGGAAKRMLDALRRDAAPTAYLFRCLHCLRPAVHVDGT